MRILTLNCFGLPIFAPKVASRLARIAEEIKRHKPDIVCLQEVFYPWHKKLIENALRDSFPYSFVPRDGFLLTGGGICVFSRFPITDTHFQKFSLTGRWTDWTWGHLINEQGFMKFKIEVSTPKQFFHTHITCNFENKYEPVKGNQAEIQDRQLSELAEAIVATGKDSSCLVVGDLNIPHDSKMFKDFVSQIDAVDLTKSEVASVRGIFYPFPKYFSTLIHQGKIDYILLRGQIKPKVSWEYFFDEKDFLSDHAGIVLDIEG